MGPPDTLVTHYNFPKVTPGEVFTCSRIGKDVGPEDPLTVETSTPDTVY